MSKDMLDASVDTLAFDRHVHVRIMNCFQYADVRSIASLVKLSRADVLAWPNFGEKCLDALEASLAELGLALAKKAPVEDRWDPFFPVTRFVADY